jgi:hypothetical protein
MANDRKPNKASCAICGVQAGYHSLRESGICDGIRHGFIDATTKERKVLTTVEVDTIITDYEVSNETN